MITPGPAPSADSASAAENVVPSADVSSSFSAPAPPAIRGWTRSAGSAGGRASNAKHTGGSLLTRVVGARRSYGAGDKGRRRSFLAVVAAVAAFDLALAAAAVVVAVLAR